MTRWNGPVVATIDMLMDLMVVAIALMAEPAPPVLANSDKPVCQMAIDVSWQSDIQVDVDTWVMGPRDRPVGYSSKDSKIFNLIRDDTGLGDGRTNNSERVCARVLPDGEYIVNLHLFSSAMPPPFDVLISVVLVDPYEARMTEIITQGVALKIPGEELTVVRFNLKDGQLVEGSQYKLPIKIRPKPGSQGGGGENR